MKNFNIIVVSIYITVSAVGARMVFMNNVKQYRTDYEYNERTESFYKLHTEPRGLEAASRACEAEEAELMIVRSRLDVLQAHNMLISQQPYTNASVWIAGVVVERIETRNSSLNVTVKEEFLWSSSDAKDDELDKKSCYQLNRLGKIFNSTECSALLPFICKAPGENYVFDSTCRTYIKNYIYAPDIGSCYRLPRKILQWDDAQSFCRTEGSDLIVLNSDFEQLLIKYILTSWPFPDMYFFAGFKARSETQYPIEYETIFNQTFHEAGYNEWSEQPYSISEDGNHCGAIAKSDGRLMGVNCDLVSPFICERKV